MGGPSVSLRTFRPSDAEAVHRWFNRPEVTENLVEVREGFSMADAEGWVASAMAEEGRDRKWAVLLDGGEVPVGFTGLYGLFGQAAPELATLIGEPGAWGKGVGRRAESLTVELAFTEFGAHRILGLIPASNEPAKAVVRQLGFRHEGVMRRHARRGDSFVDIEVFGLLPEEFTSRATG